jgi:hypothetical protein
MILLFFVLSQFVWGQKMQKLHAIKVYERHEFYENKQEIKKPADSWQHLFSFDYIDNNLTLVKQCVFYKVPGVELGVLKLKNIVVGDSCDNYLLKAGDQEFRDIKSLDFSIIQNEAFIDFILVNMKLERWHLKNHNENINKIPTLNLSSTEFKSSKLILVSRSEIPKDIFLESKKLLPDQSLCHDISDDCSEKSKSNCSFCQSGWYEIPNGCDVGPKYCGYLECGGKNQPACRRGMKWQRHERRYDCRDDNSFAYCSKGFNVECEGAKAFCR